MPEENFTKVLNTCWEQTKGKNEFHDKHQLCGDLIMQWVKADIGNTSRKIQQLSREINNLYGIEDEAQGEEDIQIKERELEKLLLQEEIHWQQRSRKQWLEAGDKSTSFCSSMRESSMK